MKKFKYAGPLFVSILFFTACGPTVNVQKDNSVDLSAYKTYMWVDSRSREGDSTVRPATYADIPVRNAANSRLAKSGWTEVKENPDVLISYDVMVERGTVQRSDPVYSQSQTRSYYNPRTRRWSYIYYPSQFLGYDNYDVPVKEGTITISMMDGNTDKIVWQGWTTESLNYSRLSTEEIEGSVTSIFKKFDPGK